MFFIFLSILCYFIFDVFFPEIKDYFILDNYRVIYKYEIWRLFTAFFVHPRAKYLWVNMVFLVYIGPLLETNSFSKYEFLITFVISGLIGNLAILFISPIDTQIGGLSGVNYGLMAAFSIRLLKKATYLPYFFVSCIVNLIFNLLQTKVKICSIIVVSHISSNFTLSPAILNLLTYILYHIY